MEDLTKLSKTELIERLKLSEEAILKSTETEKENPDVSNPEAFELDNLKLEFEALKKEHTKLVLKHGKKVFELIITEFQLESLKRRNLWDRIWNR